MSTSPNSSHFSDDSETVTVTTSRDASSTRPSSGDSKTSESQSSGSRAKRDMRVDPRKRLAEHQRRSSPLSHGHGDISKEHKPKFVFGDDFPSPNKNMRNIDEVAVAVLAMLDSQTKHKSSYVRRHRKTEQQRSIAGFEEQHDHEVRNAQAETKPATRSTAKRFSFSKKNKRARSENEHEIGNAQAETRPKMNPMAKSFSDAIKPTKPEHDHEADNTLAVPSAGSKPRSNSTAKRFDDIKPARPAMSLAVPLDRPTMFLRPQSQGAVSQAQSAEPSKEVTATPLKTVTVISPVESPTETESTPEVFKKGHKAKAKSMQQAVVSNVASKAHELLEFRKAEKLQELRKADKLQALRKLLRPGSVAADAAGSKDAATATKDDEPAASPTSPTKNTHKKSLSAPFAMMPKLYHQASHSSVYTTDSQSSMGSVSVQSLRGKLSPIHTRAANARAGFAASRTSSASATSPLPRVQLTSASTEDLTASPPLSTPTSDRKRWSVHVAGRVDDTISHMRNLSAESAELAEAYAALIGQRRNGSSAQRDGYVGRDSKEHIRASAAQHNDLTPALDFLPKLRHQPLPRSHRRSHTDPSHQAQQSQLHLHPLLRAGAADPDLKVYTDDPSSQQVSRPRTPPSPSDSSDLRLPDRSPKRLSAASPLRSHFNASDTSMPLAQSKPAMVDKFFVVCCQCTVWHDLPAKVLLSMNAANNASGGGMSAGGMSMGGLDDAQQRKSHLPDSAPGTRDSSVTGSTKGKEEGKKVACNSCGHGMTIGCCAGYAADVHITERRH